MSAVNPIEPYFDALRERFPTLAIFDVHTHIGANDPDGIPLSAAELVDARAPRRARGRLPAA